MVPAADELKLHLEHERLAWERERQAGEWALRREELAAKAEQDRHTRHPLGSPLLVTCAAAIIGLLGTGIAAVAQSYLNRQLERERFNFNQQIEGQKQRSELILKAIGTGNIVEAANNLRFMVEAGLIDDPGARIAAAVKNPETLPVLPRPSNTAPVLLPPTATPAPPPTTGSRPPTQASPAQVAATALDVARSQVDVREQPPGSNGGPQVDAYLRSAGLPSGTGWSAAFVYWCFDQAATQLGGINPLPRTGSASALWTLAEPARFTKVLAAEVREDPGRIRPGMIFVMDFGAGIAHTGVVEQVDGDSIVTIEGNTNAAGARDGGGVRRMTRKISAVNKGFLAPL